MRAKGLGMRRRAGLPVLAAVMLAACASTPETDVPGSTSRTLSRQEVDGLLQGRGMGMAAPAEINGYPGPAHVLELKEELGLTPDQRFATSRLVGLIQGQARALGQRIVDAEKRLDTDMAEGKLSADSVRARLETIAALRAQLRFTHIDAHLKQKKILTPEQVTRYYTLRGRAVSFPEPATPPAPTEPLLLPATTPAALPVATPESPPATVPAPASAPVVPAEPEPASQDQPVEVVVPSVPALPAPEEAGKPLSPGITDALEDAEPASKPPAYPLTPLEENPQPPALLLEDETPAGVEDAAAEPPLIPVEENSQPPSLLLETPSATNSDSSATKTPSMTPGMQDALELAEPAPAEVTSSEPEILIAPPENEEPENELQELEPRDETKPATVDLNN